MVICYENLQLRPKEEIKRIARFLGLTHISDERINKVVERTKFEAMKANPRTNYSHWDTWGIRDKKRAEFMRKGQIGDHENYFKDRISREHFNAWIEKNSNVNFIYNHDDFSNKKV